MADHIFSMHDPGPWQDFVRQAGRTAWCVHTEGIGHNPTDRGGKDFTAQGITPIVRLNNAYGSEGSIPLPGKYPDFAQRCANFVAASTGCKRWIISNEVLQLQWEWPSGVKPSLPEYVACYQLCYDAIKRVQPDAIIMPQAVATWNNLCQYPGNERGDWVKLVADQLNMIGPGRVGAIALHAYSKGYDRASLQADNRMDPPFQDRVFNWRVLYEQMYAIPPAFRGLECHLTECNGDGSYPDQNSGWIQAMYGDVQRWNESGLQKILSATLFRWAPHDQKWDISRHSGSVDDFRQALRSDYRHNFTGYTVPAQVDGWLHVVPQDGLNLRQVPSGAVMTTLVQGAAVLLLGGKDGEWVNVRTETGAEGWVHGGYIA